MIRIIRVWYIFWPLLCVVAFGQSDYLTRLLPSGVVIGMNGAQLRETRKDAIKRSLPEATDSENNYDLVERTGRATFSWYYVRNGVLSGYTRTSSAIVMGKEQQEAERELIIPSDDSGIIRESEEQALRAGQDLEAVIISASRWKLAAGNLRLYTVSTNQEITAVIFNPSDLSRETFLASPDLKKGRQGKGSTLEY